MTKPPCQLEDFHFTRLAIEWHEPREAGQVDLALSFDYDVGQHSTEKNRYRLAFRFGAKSATPEPIGYEIDAEIVGFFTFPEDTEQRKMDLLIRLNGGTILYGLLRGQIANLTAQFPQRKFVLSTFMMRDIIEGVEADKAAQRKAKKLKKAATRPEKSKLKRS
jgi:preprotein translocase subunit SecB